MCGKAGGGARVEPNAGPSCASRRCSHPTAAPRSSLANSSHPPHCHQCPLLSSPRWQHRSEGDDAAGGGGGSGGAHRRGPPPFRWEPGPVTRAMERGRVLLLRGIDAPEPAVLESLNAILEVDVRHATLRAGGGPCLQTGDQSVRPGFYVICTTRESQHSLTPALASRFLAVPWGGEDGRPCKITGAGGFRALVEAYTCRASWPLRRAPSLAKGDAGMRGQQHGNSCSRGRFHSP